MSRTFSFDGNRVDIGGHRFFSQNKEVIALRNDILPMQVKKRKSHILYNGRYIEYPIRFSWDLCKTLGFKETCRFLYSYMVSLTSKREIKTLEDYYIKQFGERLYKLFFEKYTEKLWGIPADKLSADWGVQRVRRVSVGLLLSNALSKMSNKKDRSLIESFYFPEYGAGQIWEAMSREVQKLGVRVELNSRVISLECVDKKVDSVSYVQEGIEHHIKPDMIISSMPLADLILDVKHCPESVKNVAKNLQYRDMIIVAVCIQKNRCERGVKKT